MPQSPPYLSEQREIERNYLPLTFKGDVLHWPTFWQQFSSSVDTREDLPDSTKLAYLRTAVKDPEAALLLHPSMDGPHTYKRLVKELHLRYERTKKIHRELVDKLINLPAAKYNSHELRKLVDATNSYADCLSTTGHFTLEAFISSIVYSKLPYKLQIDWDNDQPDDNVVVPYPKLLEYVTKKVFTLSDHKTVEGSKQLNPNKQYKEEIVKNGAHREEHLANI